MEVARSEQELVRREKLEKIKEYCNPYPEKYEVTNSPYFVESSSSKLSLLSISLFLFFII